MVAPKTKKKPKSKNPKLEILTTEFRASYPHLFKPSSMEEGGKLMYSIEMLFDKKTTDFKLIQAPIRIAIEEEWGTDKSQWPNPLQLPYRDGDKPKRNKETGEMEVRPEHKGMWIVRANSSAEYSRPPVVGRDSNVPLESETEFYAGCYARASLKAFAYTFGDKEGVKFILNGVQKIRDGEPLGGRKPANKIFGIIEGDADDDLTTDDQEEDTQDNFM